MNSILKHFLFDENKTEVVSEACFFIQEQNRFHMQIYHISNFLAPTQEVTETIPRREVYQLPLLAVRKLKNSLMTSTAV